MAEVRTALSGHKRFCSPSPKGVGKIYEERILEDGTMGIVHTGDHDLNAFVQASKESTLVYNILDKFAKVGDPSILDARHGFYADVTEMPSSLLEAQNLILSIDKKFVGLDAATKEKFDNNVQKFTQAIMDGSISEILGKKEDLPLPTFDKEGDEE